MTAYYNEFDPNAAAWLRELIRRGLIAPGDVDDRSILDVRPDDLKSYTQCHFFAGIGVWSYALRRAGWPDDRPVWTGSCPCQPFSAAGKGAGFADERHLWPAFHWLIEQRRPAVVFGEQVASKDGLAWLDLVQADLEGTGYASRAVDLCAAGVGAPHIRQRLWWVAERLADTDDAGLEGRWEPGRGRTAERLAGAGGVVGGMADTDGGYARAEWQQCSGQQRQQPKDGRALWLADSFDDTGLGSEPRAALGVNAEGAGTVQAEPGHPRPTDGHWRDADWLYCRDGKWRPVEPGTFPLAHGSPARVGRLRGYGNAIVAPAAQVFIEAYLETEAGRHLQLTPETDIFS